MNHRRLLLLSSLLVLLVCGPAVARKAESTPLCAPPLEENCVQPNWGQVEPDATDAVASVGTSRFAKPQYAGRIGARLMPAATASLATAQLKARVDATGRFTRQTAALTDAIRKAQFDDQGRLVRGEAAIAAAAENARKSASGYELTLYIKAPTKLAARRRALLNGSVAAINDVLDRSASPGKPRS